MASDHPGVYRETFDAGPGGWMGWESNAAGARALEIVDGVAISRSPWWIDYNHAPPGAGYLHLPFVLLTHMDASTPRQYHDIGGPNQFCLNNHSTDLTNARIDLRIRGDMDWRGSQLVLLVQAQVGDIRANHILAGQPIQVTEQWQWRTITCVPDASQWRSMGSRHDRVDFYGDAPIQQVLKDVNLDLIFVLFPLAVRNDQIPADELHRLRAGEDYKVDPHLLPQGELHLDEVVITYATD